ncbi:hypothetical protein [Sporosarcina sp. P35]|uniref:hypothetical protein n=1 Tax=Sporosarcina sp. P35 TaxID=2048246 RepID=UPI001E37FD79|nr:hypothetical protein [Sporosarcina sp. P35]
MKKLSNEHKQRVSGQNISRVVESFQGSVQPLEKSAVLPTKIIIIHGRLNNFLDHRQKLALI